jgi:prevent-host-death family protein
MDYVDINRARSNLSQLIKRVENGEEIVICRAGKPVAQLTGLGTQKQPRTIGLMKGMIKLGSDFEDPLPESILDAFEET